METRLDKVQRKPVRLIAAVCNDRGIGKDGRLPWHLPSEFQYFLNKVTGVSRPGKMNMVVWGKLCWYSNPGNMFPVANVLHVVLSRTLNTVPDHAHFLCQDFESAIRLATEPPLADLIETIWIVGGTQVYKAGLNHPWCDLVYLTDIMADFDCNVFFPEFDRKLFKVQERYVFISPSDHYSRFPGVPSGIQEENGIKYKFQVFKKEVDDAL
ncbi:hypothetical protein L3Q82_024121 [Scortum barcoo]|uniref:Uncharacterized protein n=1 Tax=Scortum barcoo TaxID=214431 RepID=A0ACB8WUQ3_9TELE|nr:hypothetical protein L3Q82_024121 [Scortum barcoo]